MAAPQETRVDTDMGKEAFRRLGYHAVDMMAEHFEGLREARPFPRAPQGEVEAALDEPLPVEGQDPERVLDDWRHRVLAHASLLGSPRWFGFVNGSGTQMGALAAALEAAVNMNVGAWKASPSGTEVERRTVRWVAEMIGYPAHGDGLFTSGGTVANVTALYAALRRAAGPGLREAGLQGAADDGGGPFTLYMSDHEGHSSVYRAAEVLGLGRGAVRPVASRDDFTMDPGALADALDADAAAGMRPFCVVAQVGSINVGAIDPLEALADVCEARGVWLHADGACGAVGAILPDKRPLYRGMERADSVTLDPHKWLYVPYECGCVLTRHPEALTDAFSMHASYLKGTLPTAHTGLDYLEHGPQMSRGFRALRVWMGLKHWGVEGYRRLLARNVRCAERVHERVVAHPDFEALHAPTLYIYSFRYAPRDLQAREGAGASEWDGRDDVEAYLDRLNQRVADEAQLSGLAFIMTTNVRGRTVLRVSICSHRTTEADMDAVFDGLADIGARLDAAERPEAAPGGQGP